MARLSGDVAGISLTVAMVVHAIALLAQLLRPKFAGLRLLTVVLFTAALGKLFLVDLVAASSLQKVVAFIALGALCLGAAYVFQRFSKTHTSGLESGTRSGRLN